jgi:hypothetical protein
MADDEKPNLRSILGNTLMGDPNKVLVPKDHVIRTRQGCWNCKHWARDKAKPLWTNNRQRDLQTALEISLTSPRGEEDPRVQNIRTMIDICDHLVATGHLGVCLGGGRTEDGNSVGDLVTHAFVCDSWSGVSGAPPIRGEDGKIDPLPMERADKLKS